MITPEPCHHKRFCPTFAKCNRQGYCETRILNVKRLGGIIDQLYNHRQATIDRTIEALQNMLRASSARELQRRLVFGGYIGGAESGRIDSWVR